MERISIGKGTYEKLMGKMFIAEIHQCVQNAQKAFDNHVFRDVLKSGFYELIQARDFYIYASSQPSLLIYWLQVFVRVNWPIIPHFCDYLSHTVLKKCLWLKQKKDLEWPEVVVDEEELRKLKHLKKVIKLVRETEQQLRKKKKLSGKGIEVRITVAVESPQWQVSVVQALKNSYSQKNGENHMDDKKLMEELKNNKLIKNKKAMSYVMDVKKKILQQGWKNQSAIDEFQLLTTMLDYLKKVLGTKEILIEKDQTENGIPGNPTIKITNVE